MKTLYITVDPERDTPAALRADLSNFKIDAVGLTGKNADIDRVVRLFDASYEFIQTPNSYARYTVAHTTTLYALDTSGRTRMMFDYYAHADEMTK